MKIYGKLIALCAFHPSVWGTTAFFGQAPKAHTFKAHTAQTKRGQPTTLQPRTSQIPASNGPQVASTVLQSSTNLPQNSDLQRSKNIWDTSSPVIVQGGSLRTWAFTTPAVERVQVLMKTDGRPLNAQVDLWQGPDNTPQRMGIYIEDGLERPFSAVVETPRGQNTIAIRNTAQMEFPLAACVEAEVEGDSGGLSAVTRRLSEMSTPETIQGGALKTYTFAPSVASVQILIQTDLRPLNARIELLQGPNNNKQIIEVYTEDGLERPFFAVIETPGTGNVVRVLNTAPVEFPMSARIEPYLVEPTSEEPIAVISDGGRKDSGALF